MDKLNLWYDDVLLALDQIDFKLSQILLDILEALRGSSFSSELALLVGVEEWDERVLNIRSSQLEDVEVFSNIAQVDHLHLLGNMIL